MNLIIDRKRWARIGSRGVGINGQSLLLNKEGNMCCLGFDCLTLGADPDLMLNVSYPGAVNTPKLPTSLSIEQTAKAVRANDRLFEDYKYLTNAEQEEAIAAIFLEAGVTVTFIN